MATLDGKVALVTGAASGIGKATAELFAQKGARVVAVDLNADGVRRVAAQLGEAALPVVADVAQPADVQAMFAASRARFGRLDVLVSNAGVNWIPSLGPGGPIEALSLEQF